MFAGGLKKRVAAGEMVLIPADVPHRWLKIDGSVVYLDIPQGAVAARDRSHAHG